MPNWDGPIWLAIMAVGIVLVIFVGPRIFSYFFEDVKRPRPIDKGW